MMSHPLRRHLEAVQVALGHAEESSDEQLWKTNLVVSRSVAKVLVTCLNGMIASQSGSSIPYHHQQQPVIAKTREETSKSLRWHLELVSSALQRAFTAITTHDKQLWHYSLMVSREFVQNLVDELKVAIVSPVASPVGPSSEAPSIESLTHVNHQDGVDDEWSLAVQASPPVMTDRKRRRSARIAEMQTPRATKKARTFPAETSPSVTNNRKRRYAKKAAMRTQVATKKPSLSTKYDTVGGVGSSKGVNIGGDSFTSPSVDSNACIKNYGVNLTPPVHSVARCLFEESENSNMHLAPTPKTSNRSTAHGFFCESPRVLREKQPASVSNPSPSNITDGARATTAMSMATGNHSTLTAKPKLPPLTANPKQPTLVVEPKQSTSSHKKVQLKSKDEAQCPFCNHVGSEQSIMEHWACLDPFDVCTRKRFGYAVRAGKLERTYKYRDQDGKVHRDEATGMDDARNTGLNVQLKKGIATLVNDKALKAKTGGVLPPNMTKGDSFRKAARKLPVMMEFALVHNFPEGVSW